MTLTLKGIKPTEMYQRLLAGEYEGRPLFPQERKHNISKENVQLPLNEIPRVDISTGGECVLPSTCLWCRQNLPEDREVRYGIPMSWQQEEDNKHHIQTWGNFCNLRCTYAYSLQSGETDFSMRLLRRWWMVERGEKEPLSPAPHWSHLESNGGFMTREEFEGDDGRRHIFIPTTIPLKRFYRHFVI